MVDRVMAMEEGTRAYLLAPIVRDRKGEYRKEFAGAAQSRAFARVKVDGECSTSWMSRSDAGQEVPPRHRRRRGSHRGA